MTPTSIFLLGLLDYLSELIQFTYEMGVFTRKYIFPVVLFVILSVHFYSNKLWDVLTSQSFDLKIRNTPMTTGFSFC